MISSWVQINISWGQWPNWFRNETDWAIQVPYWVIRYVCIPALNYMFLIFLTLIPGSKKVLCPLLKTEETWKKNYNHMYLHYFEVNNGALVDLDLEAVGYCSWQSWKKHLYWKSNAWKNYPLWCPVDTLAQGKRNFAYL